MLFITILVSFITVGYLLYTSPVTEEEIKEMIDAGDWYY